MAGFAITDPGDPLYVVDFATVKQEADWATIKFDDEAVADFFDQQVDAGRKPEQVRQSLAPYPSGRQPSTQRHG